MKLDFKQVVVAYLVTALVFNPAMAQQQSASLIKQQQMRVAIERLSVDRKLSVAQALELASTNKNTDPALKQSLNGTTVVDIAAASEKGVSKNNWNEFNVDKDGIIFNNSAAPVLTQLGGWVDGNRRLAGGEASIILNQVTGSNRSTLLGQIEIAGKSAEFILANANGITCNGCGFINTPNVSLITGNSRFESNGDLTFDIAGGDVLIDGEGINATNLDRFDIVSRYTKINANLYANNLNVINGINSFNYNTKAITANAGSAPGVIQYAFDTTALGGMYANSIRLIGTEKGLGVNLQGLVQSTQDLFITADGNLQLKQLQANTKIVLESTSGSVTTEALIYAPDVSITAAQDINNTGFFAAKNKIALEANNINQTGNLYAGLNENNEFNTAGQLNIIAGNKITNTGDFYIGGQLNLTAPTLDNSGVWLMQSADTLHVDEIINRDTIRFNSQNFNLSAKNITNEGEILHIGNGLLTLNLSGNLDNSAVLGTNADLQLTADNLNNQGQLFAKNTQLTLNTLNNNDGRLEANALNVSAQNLLNNNGRILALDNTAKPTIITTLTITDSIENKQGVIYTDADEFALNTKNLDNTSGNVIVNNTQLTTINIENQLNNQKGFFQANQLVLNGSQLDNTEGRILASSLTGQIESINNTQGFIQGDKLSLNGKTLNNSGGVILLNGAVASALQLVFSDQLNNDNNAVIRNMNGDVELTTLNFTNSNSLVDASNSGSINLNQLTQLNNQSGRLIAKNNIQFSQDSVNNIDGYIQAGNVDFTLTGNLDNTRGVILGGVNVNAKNLENKDGYLLLTDNSSDITLSGDLNNQTGVVATTKNTQLQNMNLTAQNIVNSGELVFDAKQLNITATGQIDNTGLIQNNDALTINAVDVNTNGAINATQLQLNLANQLNNTGRIDAQSQLTLNANSVTNTDENKSLNQIHTFDFKNDKGIIVADKLNVTSNTVTNNYGMMISKSNADDAFELAAKNQSSLVLNNDNGFVQSSANNWIVNALQLSNVNGAVLHLGTGKADFSMLGNVNNTNGTVKSSGELSLTLQDANAVLTNNQGVLNAAKEIAISAGGRIDNLGGQYAGSIVGSNVTLTSAQINNDGGIIEASATDTATLTLNSAQVNNINGGEIRSGAKDWAVSLDGINNDGGSIAHTGTGQLTLTSTGNLINKGNLSSKNILSLDVLNLFNQGQISANNTLVLNSKNGITNAAGGKLSSAALSLTADNQTIENDGYWYIGKLNPSSTQNSTLQNNGELIVGDASALTLNQFINTGTVSNNSAGNLTITANKIENTNKIDSINGGVQFNLNGVAGATNGFSNSGNILVNAFALNDQSVAQNHTAINSNRIQANQLTFDNVNLINSGTVYGVDTDAVMTLTDSRIQNNGNWVNEATDWSMTGVWTGSGRVYHEGAGAFTLNLDNASDLTGAYVSTKGTATLKGQLTGGEADTLDANGNVKKERTRLVAQNILIDGAAPFVNDGAIVESKSNIEIDTSVENRAGSEIIAGGSLTTKADSTNSINVVNAGYVDANNINVSVDQFTNTGVVESDGLVTLNANSVTNAGSTAKIYAQQLSLTAGFLNNSGVFSVLSKANTAYSNLIAVDQLNNQGGIIDVTHFNPLPSDLIEDSLTINAKNKLDNTGGSITVKNLATDINGKLVNQVGNNQLIINTPQLITDKNSEIVSDGSLVLNSQSQTLKTDFINLGNLQALDILTVNAANLTNSGSILGQQTVLLNLNGYTLVNSSTGAEGSGQIFSYKDLIVNADEVNNQKDIRAVNDLQINTQSFSGLGNIQSGNLLTLNLGSDLTINAGESLKAIGALAINTVGHKINNAGEINAHNQLLLGADELTNQTTGKIISGVGVVDSVTNYFSPSEFNIKTAIFNSGLISSIGDLNINTYGFANDSTGRIITGKHQLGNASYAGNLTIDMKPSWSVSGQSNFVNTGVVYSNGDLSVKDALLIGNVNNAELIAVQNMSLQGAILQNEKSRIEAGDTLTLDFTNSLKNIADYTFSRNQLSGITGSGTVWANDDWNKYNYFDSSITYNLVKASGQSAVIYAGKNLIINGTANIENNYGSIYAGNDLIINGNDLVNSVEQLGTYSANIWTYGHAGCPSNANPCTVQGGIEYDANKLISKNLITPTETVGYIHAGGNISGNLKGKVENILSATAKAAPKDAEVANANAPISEKFKEYLDLILPSSNNPGAQNNNSSQANAVTELAQQNLVNSTANGTTGTGATAQNVQNGLNNPGAQNNNSSQVNAAAELAKQNLADTAGGSTSTGATAQDPQSNSNNPLPSEAATTIAIDPVELKKLEDVVGGNGLASNPLENKISGSDQNNLPDSNLLGADEKVEGAKQEIPALIAKAQEEKFKNNLWPLISFSVIPFNFDLKNLSGLFVINNAPEAKYLIETRPEFIEYENFIGSEYLLNALGYDADKTIKRLGDAFFENRLIHDALIQETNSNTLGDITSDYQLMQTLMDNAVATASKLQLSIGVALTPEQSASLTQDMMWLVKKKVGGQEVLVPQLYLTSVSPEKIAASKTAMAAGGNLTLVADSIKNNSSMNAGNLLLSTRGNLQQDGRLFAQGDVRLLAGGQLDNRGDISANNLIAVAQGDLNNSGKMNTAQNTVLVSTDNNIVNASTGVIKTTHLSMDAKQDIVFDAAKQESGKNVRYTSTNLQTLGDISMKAGRDIELKGTDVSAGGNVKLVADRDINLNALRNEEYSSVDTKRHKEIHDDVTHDLVNINSGGNLSIKAGQDINATGTNMSADRDINLSATRDTNITAVIDSTYDYTYDKKKKSFGRSKTTINETYDETVKGGTLDAGGNLFINAHANTEGQVVTDESGKVNLLGVVANADGYAVINGDEDVNISGIATEHNEFHKTSKSGLGSVNKKEAGSVSNNQLLENAIIAGTKGVKIYSGNDLNLVAANVISNGDVNLDAVDQLLIAAGEVKTQSEEWKTKSGVFTGGNIYEKSSHKAGEALVTGQASNIVAGGTVTAHAGAASIIGSKVVGDEGIQVTADSGDVSVTGFQNHMESYSEDKKLTVGLGDVGKNLSRPDQWVENKDGRASVKLANANYDSVEKTTKIMGNQGSELTTNGDLNLVSTAGKVDVIGSDLTADADHKNGGTVGLTALTAINVTEATNSIESQTKEMHGSAELSVVVQHQAVEVAKAALAVDKAGDKLKQAKKDYTNYQRNLDQLQTQLAQLETDLENKTPGVRPDDVDELRELVATVKDDKEFLQAGIAAAALNLTMSITALAQQTIAAAASASTYGFNAGLQVDVDATKTKINEKSTVADGSTISGNKIVLQTGSVDANGKVNTKETQTTIKGSSLIATASEGDKCANNACESLISIKTNDLNILGSKNTSESATEMQHGHVTAQVTVYGASGGASVSGSYEQSKSTDKSTTINNSQLSADRIVLDVDNDLIISGANVDANKHLQVDVDGNATLESLQNRSNSHTAGVGVSGGMSFGATDSKSGAQGSNKVGSASGVNGGVTVSNGTSTSRETVLSSLTSGGTATVNVDGKLQITGALLATVDENGKDLNQLDLHAGSLSFYDLRNTNQNSQTSVGVSTNLNLSGSNPREGQQTAQGANGKTLSGGNTNLTYNNVNQNSASKSLATLGNGNITVGGVELEHNGELTEAGQSSDVLVGLNRDTEKTNKSLWNSSQQQSIDLTVDNRIFTDPTAVADDVVNAVKYLSSPTSVADELRQGWKKGQTDRADTDTPESTVDTPESTVDIANNSPENPYGLHDGSGSLNDLSYADLGGDSSNPTNNTPEPKSGGYYDPMLGGKPTQFGELTFNNEYVEQTPSLSWPVKTSSKSSTNSEAPLGPYRKFDIFDENANYFGIDSGLTNQPHAVNKNFNLMDAEPNIYGKYTDGNVSYDENGTLEILVVGVRGEEDSGVLANNASRAAERDLKYDNYAFYARAMGLPNGTTGQDLQRWENRVRGAADGGLNLVAGLMKEGAVIGSQRQQAMPAFWMFDENGLMPGAAELLKKEMDTPAEVFHQEQVDGYNSVVKVADKISDNSNTGYNDQANTYGQTAARFSLGNDKFASGDYLAAVDWYASSLNKGVNLGLDTFSNSAAYMVNLPLTAVSTAGDVSVKHQQNSGQDLPTGQSVVNGLVVGTIVGISERVLPKSIMASGSGGLSQIPLQTVKNGGIEFFTEYGQTITQAYGETLGTPVHLSWSDANQQGWEAAVSGGFAGGSLGAVKGAFTAANTNLSLFDQHENSQSANINTRGKINIVEQVENNQIAASDSHYNINVSSTLNTSLDTFVNNNPTAVGHSLLDTAVLDENNTNNVTSDGTLQASENSTTNARNSAEQNSIPTNLRLGLSDNNSNTASNYVSNTVSNKVPVLSNPLANNTLPTKNASVSDILLTRGNSGSVANRTDQSSTLMPKTEGKDLDFADAPERNLLDEALTATPEASTRHIDNAIDQTNNPRSNSSLDEAINQNRLLDEKQLLLSQLEEMDKNPPAAGLLNQSIAETERQATLNRLAEIDNVVSTQAPTKIETNSIKHQQLAANDDVYNNTTDSIDTSVGVGTQNVGVAANDAVKREVVTIKQANGNDILLSHDEGNSGSQSVDVGSGQSVITTNASNNLGVKPQVQGNSQITNEEKEVTDPIKSLNEIQAAIFISATLRDQGEIGLQKILNDAQYAEKIANEEGTSVKNIQRNSAILLARLGTENRKAGQVVSREEFEREAELSGYKIEQVPFTYRLDGRSPVEVAQVGGFKPNPNNEPGTLPEHSLPEYVGTANYVSTSIEETNPGTLLNYDFFDGSRMIKGTLPDPKAKSFYTGAQHFEDLEFLRYEYRIKDVEGVVLRDGILSDTASAHEKEVVIREAKADQIEYREIVIKQRWIETIDEDGDYRYQLTPLRQINKEDVTQSEWQSLPNIQPVHGMNGKNAIKNADSGTTNASNNHGPTTANNEKIIVDIEKDDIAIERAFNIPYSSDTKLVIDAVQHPEAAELIQRIHDVKVKPNETKYVRITTEGPEGIKTIEGTYDLHDKAGVLTLIDVNKTMEGKHPSETLKDVNIIDQKIINSEVLIQDHNTNTLHSVEPQQSASTGQVEGVWSANVNNLVSLDSVRENFQQRKKIESKMDSIKQEIKKLNNFDEVSRLLREDSNPLEALSEISERNQSLHQKLEGLGAELENLKTNKLPNNPETNSPNNPEGVWTSNQDGDLSSSLKQKDETKNNSNTAELVDVLENPKLLDAIQGAFSGSKGASPEILDQQAISYLAAKEKAAEFARNTGWDSTAEGKVIDLSREGNASVRPDAVPMEFWATPKGWTKLIIHADPKQFAQNAASGSKQDVPIDLQVLAKNIQSIDSGTGPIILQACQAACTSVELGAAQSLADILGRPIVAATTLVQSTATDLRLLDPKNKEQYAGEWVFVEPKASVSDGKSSNQNGVVVTPEASTGHIEGVWSSNLGQENPNSAIDHLKSAYADAHARGERLSVAVIGSTLDSATLEQVKNSVGQNVKVGQYDGKNVLILPASNFNDTESILSSIPELQSVNVGVTEYRQGEPITQLMGRANEILAEAEASNSGVVAQSFWGHNNQQIPATTTQDVVYARTVPMLKDFEGEQLEHVTYLNETQRNQYEVTVENGLLVHKNGSLAGEPVHTMIAGHSLSYIFVMDTQGRIYASDSAPGMQHSSFLAGAPVAGAGTIIVNNGRVVSISNLSGHYHPDPSLNDQIIAELTKQGLKTERPILRPEAKVFPKRKPPETSTALSSNLPKESIFQKLFFWKKSPVEATNVQATSVQVNELDDIDTAISQQNLTELVFPNTMLEEQPTSHGSEIVEPSQSVMSNKDTPCAAGAVCQKQQQIDELTEKNEELIRFTQEQAKAIEKLKAEANTDKLTGLSNRRYFETQLDKEIKRSSRMEHPISMIMIDIDHFKKVNDTWGHDMGDKVLQEVAKIIQESVRPYDIAARFGGEEIVVVMPLATLEESIAIAERIRQKIEGAEIMLNGIRAPITASFGVAQLAENESAIAFKKRADELLYQAKDNGRNKVEFKQSSADLEMKQDLTKPSNVDLTVISSSYLKQDNLYQSNSDVDPSVRKNILPEPHAPDVTGHNQGKETSPDDSIFNKSEIKINQKKIDVASKKSDYDRKMAVAVQAAMSSGDIRLIDGNGLYIGEYRPTEKSLIATSKRYGVEVALSYVVNQEKGKPGQYFIHLGDDKSVVTNLGPNRYLIGHTQFAQSEPSEADKNYLKNRPASSEELRQKSSVIWVVNDENKVANRFVAESTGNINPDAIEVPHTLQSPANTFTVDVLDYRKFNVTGTTIEKAPINLKKKSAEFAGESVNVYVSRYSYPALDNKKLTSIAEIYGRMSNEQMVPTFLGIANVGGKVGFVEKSKRPKVYLNKSFTEINPEIMNKEDIAALESLREKAANMMLSGDASVYLTKDHEAFFTFSNELRIADFGKGDVNKWLQETIIQHKAAFFEKVLANSTGVEVDPKANIFVAIEQGYPVPDLDPRVIETISEKFGSIINVSKKSDQFYLHPGKISPFKLEETGFKSVAVYTPNDRSARDLNFDKKLFEAGISNVKDLSTESVEIWDLGLNQVPLLEDLTNRVKQFGDIVLSDNSVPYHGLRLSLDGKELFFVTSKTANINPAGSINLKDWLQDRLDDLNNAASVLPILARSQLLARPDIFFNDQAKLKSSLLFVWDRAKQKGIELYAQPSAELLAEINSVSKMPFRVSQKKSAGGSTIYFLHPQYLSESELASGGLVLAGTLEVDD